MARFCGRSPISLAEERAPCLFEGAPERIASLVLRVVRDRVFRRVILRAHNEGCAVTGRKLTNGVGRAEVEAAHILAVEANGPDIVSNDLFSVLRSGAPWRDQFAVDIDVE